MSWLATVLADHPIRGYRLDDNPKTNGSSIVDSGSQAQNGTVVGSGLSSASSLLPNTSDGATLFDGTSYIDLPVTGLPTGASPWSLEAWINPASGLANNTFFPIMAMGTNTSNEIVIVYIHQAATLQVQIWSWTTNIIHAANITSGSVTYLLTTYDGTTLTSYVGVNGILSSNSAAFTFNIVASKAQIGKDTFDVGLYQGVSDETWIYAACLNATQAANHYAAGLAPGGVQLIGNHKSFGRIK